MIFGAEKSKENTEKTGKNFTDINIQNRIQKNTTHSFNTVTVVHGRYSNLVSSGTVYSIR